MHARTNTSRREFLKGGSVAVAGSAIAANLISSRVHAAENKVLKVGLIGCGSRGTGAANEALRADPHTKLVAVADAFLDQAESCLDVLRGQTGIADRVVVESNHVYSGLDAYKQVIEDVDVVLLCTPPGFRPEHFRASVDAGKHIFTEKPMATDSPGVRSIMDSIEIAKEKNLGVCAGFCWRYSNPKRALFDKVHAGDIGNVTGIHGTYLTSPVKPMPPATSRAANMRDLQWMVRNWYNFAWLSGDGLVEQAVHTVDWIAWAMGDKPPQSCTAVGGRQVPSEGGDIYDHVEVNYVWENNARATIAQRQIPGCFNENNLYVLGTKGTASFTRGCRINDIDGKPIWKYKDPINDMYQTEHDEFFASLRAGSPINDGDRMIRTTLMAIMGRMAGYTGDQITWEMALNSQESLVPRIAEGWNSPVTFRNIPRPGATAFV